MDDNLIDNIQYQQWTQTDRSSIITVVQPVEQFLKCHDYVQNSFLNQLKTALRPDEYIVVADFSENYKCIVQDHIIGIQHMLLFIRFYTITKIMANFITHASL